MGKMSRFARLCMSASTALYKVVRRTSPSINACSFLMYLDLMERQTAQRRPRARGACVCAYAYADQSDEDADEEMVARALGSEVGEVAAQPQQTEGYVVSACVLCNIGKTSPGVCN